MRRGDIWWANLARPVGSAPGYRRPVLVVQADDFNASRIGTIVVVVLTSNIRLAQAPGNVFLPASATGLPKDSVANISQIVTLDRSFLSAPIGFLSSEFMQRVENGLRLILDL